MKNVIRLVERGLVPDPLVRVGIRRLLRTRLDTEARPDCEERRAVQLAFLDGTRAAPVALVPDQPNAQHYELPAAFFRAVLGPRLKYSCCWWPEGVTGLATAERRSLELTCHRAGIEDGMHVLDLGCGWGSVSLWIAQHYPRARVTGVSNSSTQRDHIRGRARELGLDNVEVVTADMNHFDPGRRFDRIVSLEMFEHIRNWQELFRRAARWLTPDGRMLLHVFCHRELAYPYEDRGPGDWMARHFFTGGMMPSDDQPYHFADHLKVEHHWRWSGLHYQRTLEAWLERMDQQRHELRPLFETTYGGDASRWWQRWRLFFLACSELFGFRGGDEWWVSHYLLAPQAATLDTSATLVDDAPIIRTALSGH